MVGLRNVVAITSAKVLFTPTFHKIFPILQALRVKLSLGLDFHTAYFFLSSQFCHFAGSYSEADPPAMPDRGGPLPL